MLTRENFIGSWAGLPVAWNPNDEFDEKVYRDGVRRCCEVGVPGVYTGGTTGEFYAMEFDEFKAVSKATVEECKAGETPVMIGCTSTYTLGVQRRMDIAAKLGADAVQVALPYWMEIADDQIIPFFNEVGKALGDMALSVYETGRAKVTLTLEQHQAVKEAVPNYLMLKANAGTLGYTPEGCEALSKFVNVFVGEHTWDELGPRGAVGCCSAMIYYNPKVFLAIGEQLKNKDWDAVCQSCTKLKELLAFLVQHCDPKGFTDTAYDRLGGVSSGFLKTSLASRAPYPSATEADVKSLQQWYRDNFPEMLDL
jgi:dihydrodipicolinate synthase/N-acetylneuraminate lyase